MFSTFLPNVQYNCTQRWGHFMYRAFVLFKPYELNFSFV